MSSSTLPSFGFAPGDVAVVTGAGSGIGAATALAAGRMGLRVAVWDLDGEAARATVDRVEAAGGSAVAIVGDCADARHVSRGMAASRELGRIRHLANVAGPPSSADLDFDDALRISVGSMRSMVEVWLQDAPPGASLVNVASVAGYRVGTASDWYSAAKAAITGYTAHLAAYRSAEVRANAVAPGMIATPRLAGFADSAVGRRVLERIPLGRAGEAAEVAWAVLYLLSPLASYVNGTVLTIDGGWTVTQ